jgi:hypothetical protein
MAATRRKAALKLSGVVSADNAAAAGETGGFENARIGHFGSGG